LGSPLFVNLSAAAGDARRRPLRFIATRYEISGSEGIYAPAGTPREIVMKLNATIAAIMGTGEMKDLWKTKAVEFVPNTPEQFAAKTRDDYEKTAALIRAAGIKAEQ
jgi:tripartite-type tricarboxylate transporter receptor subunit TctC